MKLASPQLFFLSAIIVLSLVLAPCHLTASEVAVHHREGVTHAFLLVSTVKKKTVGVGDLIQVTHGDQVTIELSLHLKDGSVHDETAVYSQRGVFRLLSDHLVQKGTTVPHPSGCLCRDERRGTVTVHYTDGGKEKVQTEKLDLPADSANGLILNLFKNVDPGASQTTVSMIAATPKPRVVKLVISPPNGQHPFSVGGAQRQAAEFVIKVDIGGVAGAVAPTRRKTTAGHSRLGLWR